MNLIVPFTHSFIWYLFFYKTNYIWSLSSTPTYKNVGNIYNYFYGYILKTENYYYSINGPIIFLFIVTRIKYLTEPARPIKL